MNDCPEKELIRRLELLGALQPAPEATVRALDRVRRTLAEKPTLKLPTTKRTWLSRLAAAAVLLVAFGLAAWFIFPSPGSARADFAEVQAAMKVPATVGCRQTMWVRGEPEKISRLLIHRNGQWRAESSDGRFAVMDPGNNQALLVDPRKREAIMLQGRRAPEVNLYEAVKNSPNGSPARALSEKTIEGKDVLGFAVTVNSQMPAVIVWADAATRLPVLIEGQGNDDDGKTVECILDEFVFDQELGADVFALQPPDGFKTEVKGVALADLVVTPLGGIGPVRFGMSREDVEKILGKPDVDQAVNDTAVALSYASDGFGIAVSRTRGVDSITCFAQPTGKATKVRGFSGKTDKGIALGMTAADIVQAYGEPEKALIDSRGLTLMRYVELQTDFALSSNGKLVEIWLFRQ